MNIFSLKNTRDSIFYRIGELTYRLSGGRWPTFLAMMYGNQWFGHKQIFTDDQLRTLLLSAGFSEVELYRKFELSNSVEFILEKRLKSRSLAKLLAPALNVLANLVRVRNKAVVLARK